MDFKVGDYVGYEPYNQEGTEKKAFTDKLSKSAKSGKVQKRPNAEKKCTSCGTTSTPVWRWGGESKEVLLCNACSLRIRRSATRPQRAKSPSHSAATKQSPGLTTGDSGSPQPFRGPMAEFGKPEAQIIRGELLRCVEFHLNMERARLLGTRDATPSDEEWASLPRLNHPYAAQPCGADLLYQYTQHQPYSNLGGLSVEMGPSMGPSEQTQIRML